MEIEYSSFLEAKSDWLQCCWPLVVRLKYSAVRQKSGIPKRVVILQKVEVMGLSTLLI